MSTNLPADLIERVHQFGTAEDLSPSGVIERAIIFMFIERSDEKLGDTLREKSGALLASGVHEITMHELIEEHVHADKSPDGGSVF